jgi:[acyl-carrier-protein] S-malonyltransferase
MEKIALLFPGQGSQFVGMGKSLVETYPEAAEIFEKAERVLPNAQLRKLCFEGPEETLKLTMNAQPAIFVVSMASYVVFQKHGWKANYAAGHSVGEYSALASAGVFSFEDGLRLVRKRGELMYEAGLRQPGTMAAILGMPLEALEAVCQEASQKSGLVEIANLNSPSQVVISGTSSGVEEACRLAKERGAKRAIPLAVSGAFHSALMEEAGEALAVELDKVKAGNPIFPVVANLTAKPALDGKEHISLLKMQIRGRVLWETTIRFLIEQGVTLFVEMEPGSVLSGLVRSIDKSVKAIPFEQFLKEPIGTKPASS